MKDNLDRKNILVIGITECKLDDPNSNTVRKFKPLSNHMNIFVLGRGKPFRGDKFGAHFYLVNSRILFIPIAFLVGSFICLSNKIDVIVSQGPLTEGIVSTLLKIIFRKQLVVELHGDWENGPFMNKKRLFSPLLRKITPLIGRWTLGSANKIRTLTQISREEVGRRFPGKQYFVFPTFTDLDIFLEEKNTSFKNYILTVAVLSPIKNIETLIDAFAKVHPRFPKFNLIIAGDGPSRDGLMERTKNLGLQNNTTFTGKLTLDEVREIMKDCYVFALPSINEGFGRVFIEAMALSKPVIATNVGGVPEIVKDGTNGFLVELKDVEALSNKLEALLSDLELAKNMGTEGRKFVENTFSNDKYITNYVSMIYG